MSGPFWSVSMNIVNSVLPITSELCILLTQIALHPALCKFPSSCNQTNHPVHIELQACSNARFTWKPCMIQLQQAIGILCMCKNRGCSKIITCGQVIRLNLNLGYDSTSGLLYMAIYVRMRLMLIHEAGLYLNRGLMHVIWESSCHLYSVALPYPNTAMLHAIH